MFLDIITGLILGIISNDVFGSQETLALAMIWGVFCSLIPDIDLAIYLLKHNLKDNQFAHHHRDILHKPIFFLIPGIALFFLSPELGSIWIIATLLHFVHDTFEGGWGIMWLYPFSKKYYTLVRYSPQKVFKSKEEQDLIASQYGRPDYFKIIIDRKLILQIILILAVIIASILYYIK